MNEDANLSKLLHLKRYEQPPPGYFDDFLREFQRRQRAELLRRPAWAVFWDRIASIAPTFRVPQFAYAAILILLTYMIPMGLHEATTSSAWPQDIVGRKYLSQEICGPDTAYACMDPRVPMPVDVWPGQQVTLTFQATAPLSTGKKNFQWRMVPEGVQWFGDFTTNKEISVKPPLCPSC